MGGWVDGRAVDTYTLEKKKERCRRLYHRRRVIAFVGGRVTTGTRQSARTGDNDDVGHWMAAAAAKSFTQHSTAQPNEPIIIIFGASSHETVATKGNERQ